MRFRKFLGTLSIIFGTLNLLNFMAPIPIPTVGISAILGAVFFIGLGFILRIDKNAEGKIEWKRLFSALRQNKAVPANKKTYTATDSVEINPMLAVEVLKLASSREGILTIAQTAIALNIPIDQAEKALDICATKGSAYIEINPDTGVAIYSFPEFTEKKTTD